MKNYKRVPFENLYNCRDLGGYGCCDGGFFRYHKIYRSDSPDHITDQEWNKIEKMGVRTIIDLRSKNERDCRPYKAPEGIEVLELPLMEEEISLDNFNNLKKEAEEAFGRSLSEGYTNMVEKGAGRIAKVLNRIGEKLKYGAVLYHCSAGKDRTGVISALIYLLCGVRDEDIIADYQVTAGYNEKNTQGFSIPEEMRHLINSSPSNMKEFLSQAREKNFLNKLYQSGLTSNNVDNIRCEIVEYEKG